MSLPIILMYLCIPFFGNGLYFLIYGSDGPPCGITSMIFFNVAFICLFLPYLFDSDKETHARGVKRVLASTYMIIEAMVALLFISNDGSRSSAVIVQGILLGIFLIVFFGVAATDEKTVAKNREFQAKKSLPLHQARINLQVALSNHTDPKSQGALRDLLADLNSAPIHSNNSTEQIENLILAKSLEVATNPDTINVREFQKLITHYKTIITFNH